MMRSAYAGVKLLFILILVEASLVCSLRRYNISGNGTEIQQYPLEGGDDLEDYVLIRDRRLFNPDYLKIFKSMRKNGTKPPPRVDPYGIVTIKLDIWNKTHDSYMANVTIMFNYLETQHTEGTWDLKWTWNEDEILLSTVGAKGTQHSYVLTGDDTCCLNSVTFEDLRPQTVHDDQLKAQNCCEDGLIVPLNVADLAKRSCSFQIYVRQANIENHAPPDYVTLITQGLKYNVCDQLVEKISTRGYQKTWRTQCRLYFAEPKWFDEIPSFMKFFSG